MTSPLSSKLHSRRVEPWNISVSTCDLTVEKRRSLLAFDASIPRNRSLKRCYRSPRARSASISEATRKDKQEFNEVRSQLYDEVLFNYPDICEENLEARAFRIFRARKYGSERPSDFESTSISPRSRKGVSCGPVKRYHTGVYEPRGTDRGCWTCCMHSSVAAKGCATASQASRRWCVLP